MPEKKTKKAARKFGGIVAEHLKKMSPERQRELLECARKAMLRHREERP